MTDGLARSDTLAGLSLAGPTIFKETNQAA